MHCAGKYILAVAGGTPTKASITGLVLSATQAAHLAKALEDDAHDYYYSACLTFVDGIRGAVSRFYTWSTVKCYYSVFYSVRAILAADGIAVFYIGTTPYQIRAAPGAVASKLSGTTHHAVLGLFARLYPHDPLLSQQIEVEQPFTWLMRRREECNYINPRFIEPMAPDHFKAVETEGVRRLLVEYIADTSGLYTFDESHAIVAYPLAVLVDAGRRIVARYGGAHIEDDEMAFLRTECKDGAGRMAPLATLINALRS